MKIPAYETYIVKSNNSRLTWLLRLLGALALYICFGLIAEFAYANNNDLNPLESTQRFSLAGA